MIRIESYHHDSHGILIEHTRGAFEDGPPRRLGCHWRDDAGQKELSLTQIENIRYVGTLNYYDRGWEHSVKADVSWSAQDARWEVRVTSSELDQPLLITALKK